MGFRFQHRAISTSNQSAGLATSTSITGSYVSSVDCHQTADHSAFDGRQGQQPASATAASIWCFLRSPRPAASAGPARPARWTASICQHLAASKLASIRHHLTVSDTRLTNDVTKCRVTTVRCHATRDHISEHIVGLSTNGLRAFVTDGHNPRAQGCEGIHLRQTWHTSCFTLPRASWSFRPCRWGPIPPRGIKGLGLRGHHTVS